MKTGPVPIVSLDRKSKFSECPKGHTLPYRTEAGACTPLFCSNEAIELVHTPEIKEGDSKPDLEIKMQSGMAVLDAAKRVIRKRGRDKLIKVPEGLTPAEAEDYVNTKKAQLTPYAIAEKEYMLLYGNDEQREKASTFILEATGHGKRESGAGSQAVIIINGWNPGTQKPWSTIGSLPIPGTKELPPGNQDA